MTEKAGGILAISLFPEVTSMRSVDAQRATYDLGAPRILRVDASLNITFDDDDMTVIPGLP
ncbi:MAG: hypothetical protein JEZ04_09560 [Spirochaetales bacterium]|nr:hypothetical protein [Spirochaetales bacterium]